MPIARKLLVHQQQTYQQLMVVWGTNQWGNGHLGLARVTNQAIFQVYDGNTDGTRIKEPNGSEYNKFNAVFVLIFLYDNIICLFDGYDWRYNDLIDFITAFEIMLPPLENKWLGFVYIQMYLETFQCVDASLYEWVGKSVYEKKMWLISKQMLYSLPFYMYNLCECNGYLLQWSTSTICY
jgi:hypothetical protein